MNVVFYYVAQSPEDTVQRVVAAIAMTAVRKHVPFARVFHLTDQTTQKLAGPCDLKRVHANTRCSAQAEFKEPALFLDTDVVVQRDIREAFSAASDVIVVKSRHPTRPHNGGVVFCRKPEFFQRIEELGGDVEIAFNKVVESGEFSVTVLPDEYNYTLDNPYEQAPKAILHYKGHRKNWMIERHIAV